MRLSDADREVLFEQLAQHAAEGRLSVEELERRVALVTDAETHEQAAAALADLPPLPAPTSPSLTRERQGRRFTRRAHGEADAPQPGWQPTGERFRDPRSGRIMRVWVDAAGGRHYVPDQP